MLGPSTHDANGEATRRYTGMVGTNLQTTHAPVYARQYYNGVEFSADVTRQNSIPLLTLILYNIHSGNTSTVDNMTREKLEFELKNEIRKYSIRGFRIAFAGV